MGVTRTNYRNSRERQGYNKHRDIAPGDSMQGDVGERKGEMERENFREREKERKREKV